MFYANYLPICLHGHDNDEVISLCILYYYDDQHNIVNARGRTDNGPATLYTHYDRDYDRNIVPMMFNNNNKTMSIVRYRVEKILIGYPPPPIHVIICSATVINNMLYTNIDYQYNTMMSLTIRLKHNTERLNYIIVTIWRP